MRTSDRSHLTLREHLVSHLRGGERTDVLLYERTKLSLVDIPNEDKLEATSIRKATTEELKYTLVVHRLDLIDRQWVALRVVWIQQARYRVSQAEEWVSHRSFDSSDRTLLPSLERLLISTTSGEVQIEKLEHRL